MSPNQVPEILLCDKDSELIVYAGYFQELNLVEIKSQIDWRQNKIRMFGKWFDEPRLTAWFGPAYTYSGIHWPSLAMPDFLDCIAKKLQKLLDVEFNSVLMNYYRDGIDSMGWHSDNEREMDTRCIASISLGATRVFALRKGKAGKSFRTQLHHGDLLVMNHLQEDWQHSIPKSKAGIGPRINMTFRRIES